MYPCISADDYVVRGDPATGFGDEDFFAFCERNPDLRIERTANQEIIIMPPVGGESSRASGKAYTQLERWSESHGGCAFESSVGYRLPDRSVLSPDASWISDAAWGRLTPEERAKFLPLCPEVVTEVKSPSDSFTVLKAKMEQWMLNGTQLGFLLDAKTETACIYRPNQPMETIQGYDRDLSGESIMPGFLFNLRKLR